MKILDTKQQLNNIPNTTTKDVSFVLKPIDQQPSNNLNLSTISETPNVIYYKQYTHTNK